MDLREPKEITVIDDAGREKIFLLSKMPATDGLEVMMRYPSNVISAAVLPKLAEWETIKGLQSTIMKYVGVNTGNIVQRLTNQDLIDNHCPDWKTLGTLIVEEVKYNNGFFRDGKAFNFFEEAFRMFLQKISEIYIQSSEQLSPTTKPASTNSEQSTP